MRKEDKLYKQRLKELKKKYEVSSFNKKSPNRDWKKNWKFILKYNFDWSDYDILAVLIYKLELTKAYLEFKGNEVEEYRLPKIKKLTEVIDLGNRYINNDYYSECNKFSQDHVKHIVILYKNNYKNEIGRFKCKTSYPLLFNEPDDEFKNWLKENNINIKDPSILTAYTGEWDSDLNRLTWMDMNKEAQLNEQKDLKKFFREISNHITEWWD